MHSVLVLQCWLKVVYKTLIFSLFPEFVSLGLDGTPVLPGRPILAANDTEEKDDEKQAPKGTDESRNRKDKRDQLAEKNMEEFRTWSMALLII